MIWTIGSCEQEIISLGGPIGSHEDFPDPTPALDPDISDDIYEDLDPFCIGDDEHIVNRGFDSG